MDRRVALGLLLIGSAVVALNGWLVFALYGPDAAGRGPMFAASTDGFPVILVPIVGFGASLFGLWRMWRLRRGSH
jgi:hypothetical protein